MVTKSMHAHLASSVLEWKHFRDVCGKLFPKSTIDLSKHSPLDEGFSKDLASLVSNLKPGASFDSMSVASSAFLFRKTLPAKVTPKVAKREFMEKLSRPGEFAGTHWAGVAEEVVDKLFPVGWDKDYGKWALFCRTNNTAALRNEFRSAREVVEGEWTAERFFRACVDGETRELSPDRKVSAIKDGNKIRVITVADAFQSQLLPMHLCIYDFLSKNRWILRGEASRARVAKSMEGVDRIRGGVFVSGDYEAATDNFVPQNSIELLMLLQERASHIPQEVWDLAQGRFAEGELQSGTDDFVIRRMGQLMGDYLSFPLLCLTNFVGFIYALGPRGWEIADTGFLLINGDDIVFYSTPEEGDRWMDAVQQAGLVLSRDRKSVV